MKLDLPTYIDTYSTILKNMFEEIDLYIDGTLPSEAEEDFELARENFDNFYVSFRSWANKQEKI